MINNSFPDYFNTSCTVGANRTAGYKYFAMTVNKDKSKFIIDLFYNSMKTNTKNNGTTQDDFQKRFKRICAIAGRNLSYISVMSNGIFNLNSFDAELRKRKTSSSFLKWV